MHVQLTPRTRFFTVMGNEVLRDSRLSFPARGILVYLLSFPEGTREDVRTLADNNPHFGRRAVAKALDELVELGYYERRTVRDERGRVRTETFVRDVPQVADEPTPAPAARRPGTGASGTNPKKNLGEKPTHPATATAKAVLPPQRDGSPVMADAPSDEASGESPKSVTAGVAYLARLIRSEPKLALSTAELLALAPLVHPWVEAAVPESEARALLTQGLPPVVHSPRALLANRLTRKLPAPRKPAEHQALAECATCRDPLPRGQRTGICGPCAGVAARPTPAKPPPSVVATRVSALRRAAKPLWEKAIAAT